MFQLEGGAAGQGILERPRVHGRFLFLGDKKFFIKGVTYGPFPENENGEPLPEPERVAEDFRLMRTIGVNTIRVYYVPPKWFLDTAARLGIHVMVGIPWPQHLCFLDQWEVKESIKDTMREAARACAGHPAVLAYLIGNEIPSHIVRWSGAKKVEKFLGKLAAIVREEDPSGLVTYANYPSTEYLKLPFLDFLCFNVYLHNEKSFRAYVKRLQNVACDMPLVLSEFGMDSLRHGEAAQAEFLDWQVMAAFEEGVSGTMVFAWTDEWYTGGHLIEDWKFGIVDADRKPKAAFEAVAKAYANPLPPLPPKQPMISVVVCAYNADSTMEGCLASFQHVEYPNFEVIVVDDGSTDKTGEISDKYAAKFPFIHVIHQPNLGLSAARNVGMYAAKGDIVAYTDSDCYVDPHWLTYMAWAFQDERFAVVGGPNLPPMEDNRTAACVAVSPGAPTHVLVTDEIAEHVPGCNMAYRKENLMEIGGFDATYRAAGDDVDVCWRLMDMGHLIGFHAGMMVWHHRRNTIKAYMKQQKGYGRAEALLMPKHPHRFNVLGNSRWAGRIYGDISGALLSTRPVIYHGVFGSGLFQTLYEPKGSLTAYLPLSFEWMMAAFVVLASGFLFAPMFALGALMLGTTMAFVCHRAAQAKLPKRHDTFFSRVIIALLTLAQPWVRGKARYQTLMDLRRAGRKGATTGNMAVLGLPEEAALPKYTFWQKIKDTCSIFRRGLRFHRFFWNIKSLEREDVLEHLLRVLRTLNVSHTTDSGYASSTAAPWDLRVEPGLMASMKLRVTVENHGGEKRFVRLAGSIAPTAFAVALTGLTLAAAAGCLAFGALIPAAGCAGASLLSILWTAKGMSHGASMVTKLTQHLMTCKAGCSMSEPEHAKPEAAEAPKAESEAVAVKPAREQAEAAENAEAVLVREEAEPAAARTTVDAPLQ
ncbi:glycosyltransferase [Fundidesulfovibrio agrisoli]|uniref:glycosyltransferase n=1 Tax=Fundidesulfovibrio agrisoli TaxID=2922717 RepID=UPI001FACDE0E|nr:glycosyltransferase [Fundidesulfovibrio agrisoli]